jgi:hypothetical protein
MDLARRRRSLLNFLERLDGKPEAYRYVLRHSREWFTLSPSKQKPPALTHPESVLAAFLFLPTAFCLLPSC